MSKDPSPFRMFVNNIYFDCMEERAEIHERPETIRTYFLKYKWWLKREYQHRIRTEKLKEERKTKGIWEHGVDKKIQE